MRTDTQIFPASGTSETLPDGRTAGELFVEGSQLVFRHPNGEIRMPLAGIKASRGGANNKLIFFEHPMVRGWSIYTRDRRVMKLLKQSSAVRPHDLSGARSPGRRNFLQLLVALAVIFAFGLGLWSLKNPFISLLTRFVPISWEAKAGEVIYTSIKAQTKIVEDDKLNAELRQILAPLLEQVKDSGYDFKFHIAEGEDLNAFALPGGHVVIYSAVLLKAKRAKEVLGVLAHEISHVTKRHTVKQIFSVLGIYFVFDVMFGNFAGTFAALTQAAPYLLQQGFSRSFEREADNQGFEYLIGANVDPSGMVDFFKRIKEEQDKDAVSAEMEKHLNFLSTHPGTEERISVLEAKVKEHSSSKYRDVSGGFKEFQEHLKSKLSS